MHIIPEDAFWWTTYSKMEEDGILDGVETHDWSVGALLVSKLERSGWDSPRCICIILVHPNLQFIAQIPNNVHGEQLIAQLIRAIPDRKWFFRYGRVPLDLLTTASMWAVRIHYHLPSLLTLYSLQNILSCSETRFPTQRLQIPHQSRCNCTSHC